MECNNYVVAPRIAEVLITTVAGLCVAIPAVIFYNYLVNRVRKFSDEMENFSMQLTEELRRELFM